MRKIIIFTIIVLTVIYVGYKVFKIIDFNSDFEIGQPIDSLNGVIVYYNGGIDNVEERNCSEDGYNLGLKYQCMEFVKRYFYENFGHKMPDPWGNTKDFFGPGPFAGSRVSYNIKKKMVNGMSGMIMC